MLVVSALSIVTFYVPLVRWIIPQANQSKLLQHHVPVDIHVQHTFHNDPVLMPCPVPTINEVTEMYRRIGLCFSPMHFEGLCDGKTTATTWIDVTYSSGNETYRDADTIAEIPAPFNYMRYKEICARNWIFDPTLQRLVDDSKSHECPEWGQWGRRQHEQCYYDTFSSVLFLVVVNGFGAIPVTGVITIIQAMKRVGELVTDAVRRVAGFEKVENVELEDVDKTVVIETRE